VENTKDIFERLKSSSFSIEKESTLHKGQVVGVYIILAPLSHDGIGELYLASSKLTEKNYVLKLLPPLLPALDPAFQERFAEAAAVLEKQHFHPGIIYTHDIGVDGNFYYIVSEYIETIKGKTYTLRDRLRRKIRMKEKKIRKLAVQVCEAMEYAINNPEAELIHTNLKPSNILFNEDGMAVIADFKELEIIGYDYFINIVKDAIKSTTVEPVVADNKNNGLSETLGNTQESILFKTAKDSISAFLQTKNC
jgi:serine/threonine protein kinase